MSSSTRNSTIVMISPPAAWAQLPPKLISNTESRLRAKSSRQLTLGVFIRSDSCFVIFVTTTVGPLGHSYLGQLFQSRPDGLRPSHWCGTHEILAEVKNRLILRRAAVGKEWFQERRTSCPGFARSVISPIRNNTVRPIGAREQSCELAILLSTLAADQYNFLERPAPKVEGDEHLPGAGR